MHVFKLKFVFELCLSLQFNIVLGRLKYSRGREKNTRVFAGSISLCSRSNNARPVDKFAPNVL